MSWQAYIDQSLVGTGHLDKAAIFNKEGTSKWAASSNFNPSAAELKTVVDGFKDSSKLQMSGLHIANEKYMFLRGDSDSIYAKKGKEGLVIVKTKQALLIAHYPETVPGGTAATTVEKLGDYLKGVGY